MFTIYGPGITNPVPLEKLFVRPAVTKPAAITPEQAIKASTDTAYSPPTAYPTAIGNQKYQHAESPADQSPSLKAAQIMRTPVVSITSDASISEALDILDSAGFRHIPVLSPDSELVGMISDRDILQCMCGTEATCIHCASDKQGISIASIMTGSVLSTAVETDARHIARLFVEQRIGAMPVMENEQLVGIITRSDILRAVMVHFDLDLWL